MPDCEARPREDETGVTVGDRDGPPRPHERALAGRKLVAFAGRQVEPCVTDVGLCRERGAVPEAAERDLDHLVALPDSVASAMR